MNVKSNIHLPFFPLKIFSMLLALSAAKLLPESSSKCQGRADCHDRSVFEVKFVPVAMDRFAKLRQVEMNLLLGSLELEFRIRFVFMIIVFLSKIYETSKLCVNRYGKDFVHFLLKALVSFSGFSSCQLSHKKII